MDARHSDLSVEVITTRTPRSFTRLAIYAALQWGAVSDTSDRTDLYLCDHRRRIAERRFRSRLHAEKVATEIRAALLHHELPVLVEEFGLRRVK